MTTPAEMLRRFQAINLEQETVAVVVRNPEVLEDYNREQLRKGKGRDGKYLLRYQDDPYFKGNVKAAIEYAKWKLSLGHSDPEKPFDVPDLFINGYTHNNLTVKVSGGVAIFQAEVPWSSEIDTKYGGNALGMTDGSKLDYRETFMYPEMAKSIKAKTGAQ